MTSTTLATQLDKLYDKLENLANKFQDADKAAEFDSMKTEALALLEGMSELAMEDSETDHENNNEETNKD